MKTTIISGLKALRRSNWLLTIPILVLLVMGILFVYSSCYVSDDQEVRPLYQQQLVWMIAGLLSYTAFAIYDFRFFKRFSVLAFFNGVIG